MAGPSLTIEERRDVLRRLPLFKSLSGAEIDAVAKRFGEISYGRGAVIWREGDPGDTFLVVVRGELEILGGPDGGQVVNRLRTGDCLGEMALLLDERRSATVTASRNTTLLTLDKQEFHAMTAGNAAVLDHFLHVIAHRLAASARNEVPERQGLVVTVSGEPGVKGKTVVASGVAAVLGSYLAGRVLTLRIEASAGTGLHDLATFSAEQVNERIDRSPLGGDPLLASAPTDLLPEAVTAALDDLLAKLALRFPAIVVDVSEDRRLERDSLAPSSDVLINLVGRNESLGRSIYPQTRVFEVLNLFSAATRPLPLNASDPYVLPADAALVGRPSSEVAQRVLDEPWSTAAPTLYRLARKILGISVGVAMGGGAAFGIAHVGVLRTLQEHGIPVDILAGTSFGSIVALGYAAGIHPDEMEMVASRIGNKRTTLSALDFTVTRPGLLSGHRLKAIFSPAFGSAETFEHLVRPCRTVATDIESGERVTIGEGRLEDAFRASCSVPMLWAPVRRDGRTLVDGAITDPVPAAVTREMGADLCIAVAVVPTVKPGVVTVLSRATRALNSLNPFSYLNESRDMPNIFDVAMNSLQVLQYELGNYRSLSADVRLSIDLSSYTWIEFYRANELIERGAEATEQVIPEIERVIAARLPKLDASELSRRPERPKVPLGSA